MARRIRHSSLLHPDTRAISDQQQQGNHSGRQAGLHHQQSLQDAQQQHQHSLDIVFYAIHLVMSAIHKRVLVTKREQLGFECAMAIFAGALLMRVFLLTLVHTHPTAACFCHPHPAHYHQSKCGLYHGEQAGETVTRLSTALLGAAESSWRSCCPERGSASLLGGNIPSISRCYPHVAVSLCLSA